MKFIFADGYRIIVKKKKTTDTILNFVQFSVSPCEFIQVTGFFWSTIRGKISRRCHIFVEYIFFRIAGKAITACSWPC